MLVISDAQYQKIRDEKREKEEEALKKFQNQMHFKKKGPEKVKIIKKEYINIGGEDFGC